MVLLENYNNKNVLSGATARSEDYVKLDASSTGNKFPSGLGILKAALGGVHVYKITQGGGNTVPPSSQILPTKTPQYHKLGVYHSESPLTHQVGVYHCSNDVALSNNRPQSINRSQLDSIKQRNYSAQEQNDQSFGGQFTYQTLQHQTSSEQRADSANRSEGQFSFRNGVQQTDQISGYQRNYESSSEQVKSIEFGKQVTYQNYEGNKYPSSRGDNGLGTARGVEKVPMNLPKSGTADFQGDDDDQFCQLLFNPSMRSTQNLQSTQNSEPADCPNVQIDRFQQRSECEILPDYGSNKKISESFNDIVTSSQNDVSVYKGDPFTSQTATVSPSDHAIRKDSIDLLENWSDGGTCFEDSGYKLHEYENSDIDSFDSILESQNHLDAKISSTIGMEESLEPTETSVTSLIVADDVPTSSASSGDQIMCADTPKTEAQDSE